MVEYILAQHLILNSGRSCFSLNLKRPVSYGSSSLSSLLICLEVAYMKQQKVAYRSMHIFLLLIKIKGHFVLPFCTVFAAGAVTSSVVYYNL